MACPVGFTTAKAQSVHSTECIPTSKGICAVTPDVCNHGKCVVVNEYEFSCECLAGFVGKPQMGLLKNVFPISLQTIGSRCAKQMTPCDSQPCFNEGVCDSVGNVAVCSCPEGFSGQLCEIVAENEAVCDLKCENGGTCFDVGENELLCLCPSGNTSPNK